MYNSTNFQRIRYNSSKKKLYDIKIAREKPTKGI